MIPRYHLNSPPSHEERPLGVQAMRVILLRDDGRFRRSLLGGTPFGAQLGKCIQVRHIRGLAATGRSLKDDPATLLLFRHCL